MAYIEIEKDDKIIKLEYDRDTIIKMEEMGYNAIDPSSKILTNYEIMIYGGMLKHQSNTKWKDAVEFAKYVSEEYGMMEVIQEMSKLVNEVFQLEGKGNKKLIVKGTKTQA